MREKITDLAAAVSLVEEGMVLSIGGSLMHRSPLAIIREIARSGVRGITLVAAAAAYGVDILCAAGVAERVIAGYVGFEAEFGLAPGFRRSVEEGRVLFLENS